MLAATLLGTAAGLVTGLTPGLHTNTITFAALPLLVEVRFTAAAGFITAAAAAHSVLEHILAMLAGVPDPSSVLALRPGVQAVLEGEAMPAVHRGIDGAVIAATTSGLMLPLVLFTGAVIYEQLRIVLPYVLILVIGLNVLGTRSPVRSILLFGTAGVAGHLALQGSTGAFGLLPVLTGLFAVPSLLDGIGQQIPAQDDATRPEPDLRNGVIGSLSGLASGFLPGAGPSSVLFLLTRWLPEDGWIPASSGINVSDALFSLIAIVTIGNPRSGAAVAVRMLGDPSGMLPALVGSVLVGTGIAAVVGHRLASPVTGLVAGRSTTPINTGLIVALLALVVALTGLHGIGTCLTFTGIGLVAVRYRVEPRMLMGVLLVPVTVYFLQHPV